MQETTSSYRPHDPGHNYYRPGIYLITLVVRGRNDNASLFGSLNDNPNQPDVLNTDIGKTVLRCWHEIPERQEKHGRKVAVHAAVCMPDHFHGVIEVLEPMDVSLGEVIRGFKAGCTKAWRSLQQPSVAIDTATPVSPSSASPPPVSPSPASPIARPAFPSSSLARPYLAERELLKRLSKKQRAAYYAQHPEAQQPLWDDNYDDTICLSNPLTGEYSQRHFSAMLNYIADNPRRAIMRRLFPQFMQRCLHVQIKSCDPNGTPIVRDYAAFGNLFLLRWPRKTQVFCHRLARRGMLTDDEWRAATATQDAIRRFENHARAHKLGRFDRSWYCSSNPNSTTAIDYTRTAAFRKEREGWASKVMAGATVIVTPGISRGEQLMKDECLEKGFPLIHLQKEPIGPLWKPEKARFDACCLGRLLILAPWKAEGLGDVNGVPSEKAYSVFHNLNALAQEICLFNGEARILRD